MNKTPVDRSFSPLKMTLQSAAFDWNSPRVQFGLGFALLLIPFALVMQEFFATRFFLSEFLALGSGTGTAGPSLLETAGQSFMLTEVWLFGHHSWEYRVFTFILFALSSALAGLIAHESTMAYGDRAGAAHGVFAALLFLSIPIGNPLILPSTMTAPILSNLLALAAVLMDMRFRRLGESGYYISALTLLALSGIIDLRGLVVGACGILLSRCFIEAQFFSLRHRLQSHPGAIPYLLLLVLTVLAPLMVPSTEPYLIQLKSVIKSFLQPFKVLSAQTDSIPSLFKFVTRVQPILACTAFGVLAGRLLFGTVWLRPFGFAFCWLVSSVLILCLVPLPGAMVWNQLLTDDGIHAIYLFLTIPFAITFALAAMPASDVLSRRARLLVTAFGAIVLSCIFTSWGVILLNEVHQRYTNARELSFFRLELGKKLEEVDGRLIVVNPPYLAEGTDLTLAERTSRGGREQLLSNAAQFFEALLNSPLIRDKAEIDIHPSYRRGLVELSKQSKAGNQSVTYIWSRDSRQLQPIYYAGKKEFNISISADTLNQLIFEPGNVKRIEKHEWSHVDNGLAYMEVDRSGIRILPGTTSDVTIWLPIEQLDPSKISSVKIEGRVLSGAGESQEAPAWLVFTGGEAAPAIEQIPCQPVSQPVKQTGNSLLASTRGNPNWLKYRSIIRAGIKLPAGSPGMVLKSVETAANRE